MSQPNQPAPDETVSDRGFTYWTPIEDTDGRIVRFHESSGAATIRGPIDNLVITEGPFAWLSIGGAEPSAEDGSAHLTADNVARLHDYLGRWLAKHVGLLFVPDVTEPETPAADVRAEATERMARWLHTLEVAKAPHLRVPWDDMAEISREPYRGAVSGYVDSIEDMLRPADSPDRVTALRARLQKILDDHQGNAIRQLTTGEYLDAVHEGYDRGLTKALEEIDAAGDAR